MKTIDYVPKMCKEPNAEVTGKVVLKVPSLPQRYQYIESAGFNVNEEGEIDLQVTKLGPLAKMIELSAPHYVSIDLKKKDGTAITSFDDLITDTDCDSITNEIAGMMINGFKPSKN
jgi:hypothetical protein